MYSPTKSSLVIRLQEETGDRRRSIGMGSSRSKPVREQQPAAPPKPKQMPEPEPKPTPTPRPKKKHDPKVEVPPLIDPPPNAARTRMLVPGYELWFGKPSLRALFDDYFNQAGSVNAGVMLKMVEDPHVNLTAAASPAGGEAQLRWQSDLDNPDTFVHFLVSTPKSTLKLRSSAHSPKYGIGAFYAMPLHFGNSTCSEDSGVMGLRYDSKNLSLGASFVPSLLSGGVPSVSVVPYGAWLVGRIGGLSAGAQCKPLSTAGNKSFPFEDLKNWDCGISYGVGSDSPLSPSLNFSLELLRSTQLVASFYQHQVVQRQVYSVIPTEATKITNYIDFGLELATRVGKDEPTDDADNSSFQIAANWQANKNLLLKGKLGPSKSSLALAFKSWWKPSFTFSFTAANDHSKGTTAYGFRIHVDDLREQVSETQLQ
ncbi:uncharacterized protein [Triticum aestivum]|nr:uncharacterized protein LOC123182258 [Triticum aestivum]